MCTLGFLIAFTVPAYAADEAKAKEVTARFLKALKVKDIDAMMNTVDVPFALGIGEERINKPRLLTERWNCAGVGMLWRR